MTRHYDRPIQVICDADDKGAGGAGNPAGSGVDAPARLIWRETPYRVRAVLARWHLRTRWWAEGAEGAGGAEEGGAGVAGSVGGPGGEPAADRFYFRLHCVPELICVVYYDAAARVWRLEAIYD